MEKEGGSLIQGLGLSFVLLAVRVEPQRPGSRVLAFTPRPAFERVKHTVQLVKGEASEPDNQHLNRGYRHRRAGLHFDDPLVRCRRGL